jgi:hypothetical protein
MAQRAERCSCAEQDLCTTRGAELCRAGPVHYREVQLCRAGPVHYREVQLCRAGSVHYREVQLCRAGPVHYREVQLCRAGPVHYTSLHHMQPAGSHPHATGLPLPQVLRLHALHVVPQPPALLQAEPSALAPQLPQLRAAALDMLSAALAGELLLPTRGACGALAWPSVCRPCCGAAGHVHAYRPITAPPCSCRTTAVAL